MLERQKLLFEPILHLHLGCLRLPMQWFIGSLTPLASRKALTWNSR